MKLLHICAVGFTVKNLLRPQIDYFLARGLQVEVACSPGAEVTELQHQGYTVHPVPIERRIAPGSNLRSVLALTGLIRRQRYDAVHVHTPVASVLGRLAARLAGTPCLLYTAHGFYFHDEMPRRTYRLYHSIERAAGWLTDLILTQSREDFETAAKTRLCPRAKLRYLGNGVDLERFRRDRLEPRAQQALGQALGIPAGAFPVIGMTGRITAEKGYRELIAALAQVRRTFPQTCLLVIGGQLSSERDAFQGELGDRLQQQGLTAQVIFTGFRSDIPELLGLLDIFCLPSYREGLPRSILEAMAMELPVVTTDIRGCREAVVPGETGLIVPPRQSQPLAAALEQLASQAEQRRQWGRAGRARVAAEFDERFVFERLAAAYRELQLLP